MSKVAILSSQGKYTLFSFGGKEVRFRTSLSLKRYLAVKKWHAGYLEVEAEYADGVEEEYIDLRPILRNLFIDPERYLALVEKVEVRYA